MGKILYKELSYQLQGIFFDIRNNYGPGQKEIVYANLLAEQFKKAEMPFEREKQLPSYSQETGKKVGVYKPDFLIDEKIVIEIKASRFLSNQDEQQLYYYLQNSKYELGYLVNFGTPELFVKRILYTNNRKPFLRVALAAISCLFVLFFASIRVTEAAQLFLYPDPIEIPEDSSAIVEVRLDTEGQSVNAAEVLLRFPSGSVTIREVLTGGSVLPIAPEPPFVGTDTVKISGGAPSGFNGGGTIARLEIAGRGSSRVPGARIDFEETTRVLLNDGKATPARVTFRSSQIQFLSAGTIALASSTHPNQSQWYTNKTPILYWDVKEGASYSYRISRDSTLLPDDIPDSPIGNIKLEIQDDGVYYVTLKEIGTSNVSRFRIMIDSIPPEVFEVAVIKNKNVFDGDLWYAAFIPSDMLSGIMRIEAAEVLRKNETPQWVEAASPYVLRDQERASQLIIRAIDRAGNIREIVVAPQQNSKVQQLILAAALLAALFFVVVKRLRSGHEHAIIEAE